MDKVNAKCDKCKKIFTINELKTEAMGRGIEKVFFVCPHCEHEYVAFYTDNKIRLMQSELQRLISIVNEMKNKRKIKEGLKMIERKRQDIAAEIERLMKRMV
jgi:NAD-dependent SIR2 family protein deacetylase